MFQGAMNQEVVTKGSDWKDDSLKATVGVSQIVQYISPTAQGAV